MCKTFRHGGKIGDVIYSLPNIRELGGGILYLPERTPDACSNLYSSLKDLLLLQPYIKEVREYPPGLPYMKLAPDIHIDYDLDLARLQPNKGLTHIVKRYMDAFGVKYENWKDPWLMWDENKIRVGVTGIDLVSGNYALINYTGRHLTNDYMRITSKVDWGKVFDSIESPVYFIGTSYEHEHFESKWGVALPHIYTGNMLHVAYLVKNAKAIYCNQSSILSLAQGFGKTYYLETKPMKRNCLLETNNENILQ